MLLFVFLCADGCPQCYKALTGPGEARVPDPHVGAEVLDVWGLGACCVPNPRFAAVEADSCMCVKMVCEEVVDWPYPGWLG